MNSRTLNMHTPYKDEFQDFGFYLDEQCPTPRGSPLLRQRRLQFISVLVSLDLYVKSSNDFYFKYAKPITIFIHYINLTGHKHYIMF